MLEPKPYKNLHHRRSDLIQLLGTKRTNVLDSLVEKYQLNVFKGNIYISPNSEDYAEEMIVDDDEVVYIANSILINTIKIHLTVST